MSDCCRCGVCCELLILEATEGDAKREPRIAKEARVFFGDDDDGNIYRLNRLDPEKDDLYLACIFFSRDEEGRGMCDIYDTRPDMCREFSCSSKRARTLWRHPQGGVSLEKLVQLGFRGEGSKEILKKRP